MEKRLERADMGLLALCALVAALSLAVGAGLFYKAFPEAGIDFAVPREESRLRAGAFLADRGLETAASRHSVPDQRNTHCINGAFAAYFA